MASFSTRIALTDPQMLMQTETTLYLAKAIVFDSEKETEMASFSTRIALTDPEMLIQDCTLKSVANFSHVLNQVRREILRLSIYCRTDAVLVSLSQILILDVAQRDAAKSDDPGIDVSRMNHVRSGSPSLYPQRHRMLGYRGVRIGEASHPGPAHHSASVAREMERAGVGRDEDDARMSMRETQGACSAEMN